MTSKQQIVNDKELFQRITEPLRRGRRRVKPEYVPELAAWLVSQSFQYLRIVEHFQTIQTRPEDAQLILNGEYAKHALSVIQTLINGLSSGIDGNNWREAVAQIREYLGVEAGDRKTDVYGHIDANPIELEREI